MMDDFSTQTSEDFRNIFLEDWAKLNEDAKEILEEAKVFKKNGESERYLNAIHKYNTYITTAETMLTLALKFPVAEA